MRLASQLVVTASRIGRRLPVHSTALGKVLLGCSEESVREQFDREIVSGSDLLFPHSDGKQPMKNYALGQTIKRLCKSAEIEHFTPRDLRRTWKTLAGSIGLDLEIRNRVQGHAFQDVGSKHYDRYAYLPEKRTAMARWCGWLARQVTGDDNVVRLA